MKSTKKIVYYSRFKPLSNQDGGFRRTAQIVQALEGFEFEFVSASDFYGILQEGRRSRIEARLRRSSTALAGFFCEASKCWMTRNRYIMWSPASRENFFVLNYISRFWRDSLEPESLKLALVEDPVYFAPLVEHLHRKKIPVVGICQNIEALSPSQVQPHHQTALLAEELELLRKCRCVITISDEETALLTNMGINTCLLPYHPTDSVRSRLGLIREKRKKTEKRDYLLLGSTGNLPTRDGMKKMLEQWSSLGNCAPGRLIAGGYGSNNLLLSPCVLDDSIVFKGELPDPDLDRILETCKGAIVYQEQGSGALTRICEYLLAGVPVYANSHAARSYRNLAGLHEFCSIEQLCETLLRHSESDLETTLPQAPDPGTLKSRILACIEP